MALEKTGETNDKSELFYDQITSDRRSDQDSTTSQKSSSDDSRTDRALESTGKTDGTKTSNSIRESESDRQQNSKNLNNRTTTELANIAFQITFNVPFVGTVPTASTCK